MSKNFSSGFWYRSEFDIVWQMPIKMNSVDTGGRFFNKVLTKKIWKYNDIIIIFVF